jgi:hypothetical protein
VSALKLSIKHWGEVMLDKRELRAVMRAAGNDIARRDRTLIGQSSGAGRLYRGGGGSAYRGSYRPGAYRASAPGQPPVRVSGTLRSSVKVYVYRNAEGFAVRERAFYALFLEAGASGGGNPGARATAKQRAGRRRARARSYGKRVLQPRPHLDRVMQQEAPNLNRRVREALTRGLKWRETTK